MLEACGLESTDFYDDEKILIRENLEKNYKFLIKMVDVRQPGDVKGFFINVSFGSELFETFIYGAKHILVRVRTKTLKKSVKEGKKYG